MIAIAVWCIKVVIVAAGGLCVWEVADMVIENKRDSSRW